MSRFALTRVDGVAPHVIVLFCTSTILVTERVSLGLRPVDGYLQTSLSSGAGRSEVVKGRAIDHASTCRWLGEGVVMQERLHARGGSLTLTCHCVRT